MTNVILYVMSFSGCGAETIVLIDTWNKFCNLNWWFLLHIYSWIKFRLSVAWFWNMETSLTLQKTKCGHCAALRTGQCGSWMFMYLIVCLNSWRMKYLCVIIFVANRVMWCGGDVLRWTHGECCFLWILWMITPLDCAMR